MFQVREYDFYEYKCEDDDMVADTASTFKLGTYASFVNTFIISTLLIFLV